MIPASTFAGRCVAVFGLGRSGIATCRSLIAGGATVLAWDENVRARRMAEAEGLNLTDLSDVDWHGIDSLVLAPGVPLTHPMPHWIVVRAREANVEIIGDIEIFARERAVIAPDAPFIAITGTNGKSTTTALIAHVLAVAGRDAQMGGNIGVPILSLDPLTAERVYVIEMSSYQIDLTQTLKPSVGVLLNVSPDHIDRHGTFANYVAIKKRLVWSADTAVISVDDEPIAGIARDLIAAHPSTIPISARLKLVDGYYFESGRVFNAGDGGRGMVASLDGLPALRGQHSAQNVMATYAALNAIGIAASELDVGLKSFSGLAHRLEEIGRRRGVLFINDSKATNAESAAVALASFQRDIFWICGGRAKQGGVGGLAEYFPRIARAYLIGESEEDFAAQLENQLDLARCGTLEVAVAAAARDAASSDSAEPVVLLAPACASFDQYESFETRGNHFRAIVEALPGIDVSGGGT
ncbi:MAG: UDP-N-acetylmuramoyl-L-alanine--D-glutamate ligase [Hyphomicrobiaceae bacterium]